MDHETATVTQEEPVVRMQPLDAFNLICFEVLEIEALVNAANAAMDECTPPSESRRSFDRAQALIGNAADKSDAALALIEELKAGLNACACERR